MKCEVCSKSLSPIESVLVKYPVCLPCTKKRHAQVIGMKPKRKNRKVRKG